MKRLIPLFLCAVAVVLLSQSAQAATATVGALQGKATQNGVSVDIVMGESRLKTRNNATNGNKTWLQFDLSALYAANPGLQGNITSANLTFYGQAGNTSAKNYIVNGLLDASGFESWSASTLTWNTGPGNDTASTAGMLASAIYSGAALYTGNVAAGDGILSDISLATNPTTSEANLRAFLNTDTDGYVTFALTPGGTTYLYNVGGGTGGMYTPVLTLTYEVPEPATLAILGLGGLIMRRRFA
jgi:hypothetical protein